MSKYGAISPDYQIANEGSTVNMTCFSVKNPTWYKDEKVLKSWYLMKTIILHNVREEDSGVYLCKGTNRFHRTFTAVSELWIGGKILETAYISCFLRNKLL